MCASYSSTQDIIRDFGQLFIMAYDGPVVAPDVAEFLATFRIGGVILFADNYRDPAQLADAVAQLQRRCGHPEQPLFIVTDHEGGRVQRFRDGFTRVRPMAEYGSGPTSETERIHRLMARELRAVGINLDLAPVADLCQADTRGAIGDRAFGDDPDLVVDHVCAAIAGLQGEGMIACAKHFPGHGPTVQDSHRELPIIMRGRDHLQERDLAPFRAAIAAGVETIMTAHAVYPAAGDDAWPASLSPYWMQEVLRDQLGFDGLIITDALEMRALIDRWSPAACGGQALRSGADIVLYYRECYQFDAFDTLRRQLLGNEFDMAALATSLARVARVKRRYLGTAPS